MPKKSAAFDPSAPTRRRVFVLVRRKQRFGRAFHPLRAVTRATVLFAAAIGATALVQAQNVTLEPLRAAGYGAVRLQRPLPNVITVLANVDGRTKRLLVDTSWLEDGVGLIGENVGISFAPVTGSEIPLKWRGPLAKRVTLGNVQLTSVPIVYGKFPQLRDTVMHREIAADGIIGTGFLHTCSAFVDLQNLRLYLRPPAQGRRVIIGRALTAAGMSEIRLQETAQHAELVEAEVNGVSGKLLVDTSAYLAAIDARLAAQIHARPIVTHYNFPRPVPAEDFTHIIRIDAHAREVDELVRNAPMTSLQSFKLAGVPVRAPDIRLRPVTSATHLRVMGLLGMDILGPNGAIIDFGQDKLYIYRSGPRRR